MARDLYTRYAEQCDNRDLANIVQACEDIAAHCGDTMTRTGDVATKLELICAYALRMAEDAARQGNHA